jgi:DNA polymerase delta subunit 1
MAGTTKSSFADVLAKLRSDEPASVGEDLRHCLLTLVTEQHAFLGAEGGADQWERPPIPQINARTQNVIFQQIDIQQYIADDKPMLRMFGVTEVSLVLTSNR